MCTVTDGDSVVAAYKGERVLAAEADAILAAEF